VTIDVGDAAMVMDSVRGPDGSLYLALTGTSDMRVAKVLANGTLDASFGTGGVALIDDGANEQAWSVALMPSGDVVVAGARIPNPNDFLIAVLKPDGTAQTSFNGTGRRRFDYGGHDGYSSVIVDRVGRIVAGGYSFTAGQQQWHINRFLPDGSFDQSFGASGHLVVNPSAFNEVLNSLVERPDGRLLLGGGAGSFRPTVYQVLENGTIDATFGSGGSVQTVFTVSFGFRLHLDDAGRAYLAGTAQFTDQDAFVVRLTPTGQRDTTWGTDGTRFWSTASTTDFGSIAVGADNTVLLATTADASPTVRMRRILNDGTASTTFGSSGQVDVGGGANWRSRLVLSTPDGGAVTIGDNTTGDLVLVGLIGSPVQDYAAGSNDWTNGAHAFGACLETLTGATVLGPWSVAGLGLCTTTAPAAWRPVAATTAGATASMARTSTPGDVGTAGLRFGFRTAANQAPGSYQAPLVFDVVAPAA
jgi:uncharacterized delta-60 repeat protein